MTIIEQRAAESMARNLPRILEELKRANKLQALAIQIAIHNGDAKDYVANYNKLDTIMEGI